MESKQAELFGLNVPSQSWRDEIEAAETFWLSPAAIQGCVTAYLAAGWAADRATAGRQATQDLAAQPGGAQGPAPEDYKRLPRSIEPVAREWEKWLKGAQPTLSVTFEQETAAENPKAVHLSVVHPLVRQAARFLEITEPKYVALAVESNEIPPGAHHFALYRWTKHGVKPDELLIAVATIRDSKHPVLPCLQSAGDPGSAPLPDAAECDALDARHHRKWTEAQANHIAENRQIVEHRIQSLPSATAPLQGHRRPDVPCHQRQDPADEGKRTGPGHRRLQSPDGGAAAGGQQRRHSGDSGGVRNITVKAGTP